MSYTAAENRYEKMLFRTCGKSGLKLPALSLGLWHNFGEGTRRCRGRFARSGGAAR